VSRNIPVVASLLLVLAAGSGCASRSINLKTWQKDVETYVAANGNDPAVLRDVTLSGSRRGFGAIAKDDPRQAQDANGVLLAHETVATGPWVVYLVGIVDKQRVEEIRLAAVSIVHGKATWRVGGKDAQALRRYRDHGLSQWRAQPRDRGAKAPAQYTTFPRESDAFDAQVSGSRVEATHQGSGARWEVDLARKQQ
jgi:hypothetical protein